ncbi:TaqI-like C-terminal specificity domain-containing protein [uncultured Helicobacter sp.]|uniref:TaqI-like C-terminal specificity domain-containing protein n=1 Tax=uncultured Helicobacter sp. TaxID=175537 RepID=UPI00344F811B
MVLSLWLKQWGAKYSLAYFLLVSVESQLIILVKLLCENFENELKEAFRFCDGIKVSKHQYEGKIIYPNMAKEFIAYLDIQDQVAYQGKILWAEMTDTPCFVYDAQGFYINQTCYFIPRDDKYLCAILNSKLIYFYMRQIASNLGDGAFRWIKQYIEKLPIPKIDSKNQKIVNQIIALVDEILTLKAKDSAFDISKLESQIDCLVYKLYNLTNEEIHIIKFK